jgi:hypothetical protein
MLHRLGAGILSIVSKVFSVLFSMSPSCICFALIILMLYVRSQCLYLSTWFTRFIFFFHVAHQVLSVCLFVCIFFQFLLLFLLFLLLLFNFINIIVVSHQRFFIGDLHFQIRF